MLCNAQKQNSAIDLDWYYTQALLRVVETGTGRDYWSTCDKYCSFFSFKCKKLQMWLENSSRKQGMFTRSMESVSSLPRMVLAVMIDGNSKLSLHNSVVSKMNWKKLHWLFDTYQIHIYSFCGGGGVCMFAITFCSNVGVCLLSLLWRSYSMKCDKWRIAVHWTACLLAHD